MAEATDRMGLLTQNLVDAGCSETEQMQFLQLEREGRLHADQRQIDCLDYLIYQMDRA